MPITAQHQKEALGQAYVRAVIAKAGYNFAKDEFDYGLDGTIKEVDFSFIDEISKRYKDCTLVEDVTLAGTIKMLSKTPSSEGDEAENTVRLLTKIDGQLRSITLHLSPKDHTLACDAYRDDKEVQVSGTIDKSGKYWFFSTVDEFKVI